MKVRIKSLEALLGMPEMKIDDGYIRHRQGGVFNLHEMKPGAIIYLIPSDVFTYYEYKSDYHYYRKDWIEEILEE